MAQLFRDQFQHYLNTGTSQSPTWKLEGEGVEALSIAFNPQIDEFKSILSRNATATFKNYQMESSVSNKRIDSDDDVYKFLDEARINATAIETELLEIDTANTVSSGNFKAIKYDVLITIDEFLGEDATISYSMKIKGTPVVGKATIGAGGIPTFTPTTSA